MARMAMIAMVSGIVNASPAAPASASARIVSSVAYADDEMLSDAKIARPVTLVSRSSDSRSVGIRLPKRISRTTLMARPPGPLGSSESSVATMTPRPRRKPRRRTIFTR